MRARGEMRPPSGQRARAASSRHFCVSARVGGVEGATRERWQNCIAVKEEECGGGETK